MWKCVFSLASAPERGRVLLSLCSTEVLFRTTFVLVASVAFLCAECIGGCACGRALSPALAPPLFCFFCRVSVIFPSLFLCCSNPQATQQDSRKAAGMAVRWGAARQLRAVGLAALCCVCTGVNA
ncbi:hypothetical protein TraAM80_10548 [Trypanosoma rangeli]|uniref:Uncharacterized protein n=1 Tax=Trypanosoma rangeli TaxID=5698 RepID=A0A422MNR0_TRYRA|nr:uncharacterized protein TraAM80_10548 [Trypanosoma rangeli]RNE94848.1 hypothetical protein TraAM80_10548 [Trypanosoma rangeli]|eukprot:RNE94848.1 hypothetical protein TraAM80_10548 [Trypanosoma rangeli]